VSERWVIFDACSLINFYASGFFESILSSFKTQSCIVEQVKKESLFVRKPSDLQSMYDYDPIILERYTQSGQLKLVKLETEIEKDLFIKLAKRLDDGEAATIALAVTREMDVVTDDKKAIQTLNEEAPNIETLTTLDIMKDWCENTLMRKEDIKLALENICICANYEPRKNHHLFQWWTSQLI